MGKFEVGNKMGGRKPGSLNRSTEQAKLTIARLANRGLDNIMEDFDKIKGNPNFTVIGHTTQESEGISLITRANTKIPLKSRGWNALQENE